MVSVIDAGSGFLDFSTDVVGGVGHAGADTVGYVGGGLVDTATGVGSGIGSAIGSAASTTAGGLRWGAEGIGGALTDATSWVLGGLTGAGTQVGGAVFGPLLDPILMIGAILLVVFVLVSVLDVEIGANGGAHHAG